MKKIYLIAAFLISFITLAQGPEFEVYSGLSIPNAKNSNIGYIVGLNVTPNLHQKDKYNINKEREYLNKLILGIEYSGYQINETITTIEENQNVVIMSTCNCELTQIEQFKGGYVSKQDIRALSLNFGIEIYKGWYVMSGVSSYIHRDIFNNVTVSKYRETYIDGGIKKFIKVGSIYLSPMIKFNPEVTSFGVGFSYYKK